MKRIAIFLLLSAVILSGCGNTPKVITPTSGTAQTPVGVVESPPPVEPAPPTAAPTAAATDVPAATAVPPAEPGLLAYVAADGNITLKDLADGSETKLTADANQNSSSGDQTITYLDLTWSSDGLLLAAARFFSKPVDSGLQYTFSLVVFDMDTRGMKEVLADTQTAGFAWRPGTHQLTYALIVDENYFTSRAELDETKARGIWAIDVDAGGESVEIVPPSGGFSVVSPQWSADGRIVAFAEVFAMEGSGNFAYYDMETNEYVRREQAVGTYDLLPDSSGLVYDLMTYMPNGTERIWFVNLDWTGAQRISPHYAEGYAYLPRLSPDGQQVAYFKGLGDPGEPMLDRSELFVQPVVETNDPRSLGVIESPVTLDWLADGKSLLLTVGPPEFREIITIRLEDAYVEKLAEGNFPVMQP